MNASQVIAHIRQLELIPSSGEEISGPIEGPDQFIDNISQYKEVFGENAKLSNFSRALRNGNKSSVYLVCLTKKNNTNILKIFHTDNTIFLSANGRRIELEFVLLENGAYQCRIKTSLTNNLAMNWEELTDLLSSAMIFLQ